MPPPTDLQLPWEGLAGSEQFSTGLASLALFLLSFAPLLLPCSLLFLNMSIFFFPGPFVQASTQQAAAPPEWGSQQLC